MSRFLLFCKSMTTGAGKIWQSETIPTMKLKLGFLTFLLATLVASAQTNNLTALLQQGLMEEQANRNLDAAIANYQSLAMRFDQDRQLAATAVFRLGECYRAQGKTNEAAKQYQRILSDFADQKTLATLSQQNLTGMGMTKAETAAADNSDVQLWGKLKDMPRDELEKILPTVVPDAVFTILLQRRNETEATLAQMQVNFSPENPEVLKQKALLDTINKQLDSRLDGIIAGLKMRAEISQPHFQQRLQSVISRNPQSPETGTTDDEDKQITRIQQMIQTSPDLINAEDSRNATRTPLINAASMGWLKVTAYLLNHGADVNRSASDVVLNAELQQAGSVSPLLAAVSTGNKAMTQFLIEHGANVNFKGPNNGVTPLHLASRKGFQAVAEVLLANHADANARDNAGQTPLFAAVQGGQLKIIQMLVAAGANPNLKDGKDNTVLNVAIKTSPEMFKTLLAAGADPNTVDDKNRTPLSYSVERDSLEVVKMLLAAKADPNGGFSDAPLLVAIHKKDVAAAEVLLQAGANPNTKGTVDLSSSTFSGGNTHYSITPLALAVSNGQLPIVQLLLRFKAAPNDSQTDGKSLLFSALGNPEILTALLEAGAIVDVQDQTDNTSGPGVPGRFPRGFQNMMNPGLKRTPLLSAAGGESNVVAVAELLQHGANPNVCDGQGNTALHHAAMWLADEKVFALLLDAKANPNVRNNEGKTSLDLVKERLNLQVSGGRFPSQDQSGINYGQVSAEQKRQAEKLIALLHQHGALDNLPDWDRITISRPSANFSEPVYYQGTNGWNRFTLLEAVLNFYGSSRTHSVSQGNGIQMNSSADNVLPFPDLSRVIILRPSHSSTNQIRIAVNLLNQTNGVDCSKDVPLEFGDVVEIPERDHALGDKLVGLIDAQRETLFNFLKASVRLVVRGQTVKIPIYPCFDSSLSSVLEKSEARNLLLSSSDLSQVKVIRHDPKTGKNREWILDCRPSPASFNGSVVFSGINQTQPSYSELWLRDGDVIEVPEKP